MTLLVAFIAVLVFLWGHVVGLPWARYLRSKWTTR